jgi:hypothetical protein
LDDINLISLQKLKLACEEAKKRLSETIRTTIIVNDFYNSEPIAAQNTSGKWLTWWPSGKRILKEQSDWLGWMNGAEIVTFNVICTIKTNLGTKTKIVHENVNLQAFETFVFNTGFDANSLDAELEAGEVASSWEFGLGFLCTNCECIKVSFDYGGESFVFNVPKYGIVNDKNQFFIGPDTPVVIEIYWDLKWIITIQGFGTENANYFNENDVLCPVFTEWIYEGITVINNLITSECYCDPINVLNPEPFRYYFEKACLTKQVVYFNSFGVPESFILSAEFQQNITTSQELATRTESYALNNLLPQNYIFDAKNVISYQAETMMLSNLEAERLMPLVNSTITFLLEKGNFIPVIINAGTTAIYKVNSFLQKIQLDLVRANESDRVSYFEVLPDFEPAYSSGILWLDLKRNGLNITDFGSIKAYYEGTEIKEFTYQSTQKYYIASDALIQEGIITFVLTCEVNGVETIVRKQYNYKWEQMDWVFYATPDNLLFRMDLRGAFADQPFRIDWGDGTSEDLEITNSVTNYNHTYSEEGKYFIRVFKPSFSDLRDVKFFDKINYFDFAAFTGITDLTLEFGSAGKYYFNGIKDLENVEIKRTTIEFLNLGFHRNLEVLTLDECVIDSDTLDALLLELWTFRKGYLNAIAVTFTDLGYSPSAFATSIVDGTGVYAGDGLTDYSITVTFS